MQADEENEKPVNDFALNLVDNSNEDVTKLQVKEADHISVRPYNYDELEEKLKQICDGYLEENNLNNSEKSHSISDNQKEVLQQASKRIPVHRSINYKFSSRSDIGHMLTNDAEDIEIIFSAENEEEDSRVRECASRNNDMVDETEKLNSCTTDIDSVSNTKEVEIDINVTPNIMAAMRRKRKTRDEIMKSIEKSIRDVSSQDTNSVSDSDVLDDTTKVGNTRKKIQKTQDDESSTDASPATTRFTVKVTGHPDDVSDIMHNLSKNTGDAKNIQEYNDTRAPKEDNAFVTSVITIDECAVDVDDTGQFHDDDLSACVRRITTRCNDWMLPSTSRNNRCLNLKGAPHSDEELNNLNTNNNRLTPTVKNATQLSSDDYILKYEYEKLQRKSTVQADVVKQLSNQLILCKRAGQGLKNKNSMLEEKIRVLTHELNARTNNLSSPARTMKENVNVSPELMDDLSSRLSYFEEVNKKLVKDMSVRSERVKRLESQVRQKDNLIKDLNWKLEKASKFIGRADKNMNTYRKKLLNLQTIVRRKKLSDEKMTRFNEILMNSVKESYSGKILPMSTAIEIKKTCGTSEYDKLLSSGFPLPALSAVRYASDNLSDSNESTNEVLRAVSLRRHTNEVYATPCAKNKVALDSLKVESVGGEIASDDTETVMRTVQDLFEESNDDDDFSTNDLTEHFISQLHTFM